MEINRPTWYLRSPRCPCCAGEGSLVFSKCPHCNQLMFECNEVGTIFPDIRNLRASIEIQLESEAEYGTFKCPYCGAEGIGKLNLATDDEIRSAGFSPTEYE